MQERVITLPVVSEGSVEMGLQPPCLQEAVDVELNKNNVLKLM